MRPADSEDRFYCPLRPCIPDHAGIPNDEIIRQSRSFATADAYTRHAVRGHLISDFNVPLPLMTADAAMRRYMEDGR
jgi:hypothetical protein